MVRGNVGKLSFILNHLFTCPVHVAPVSLPGQVPRKTKLKKHETNTIVEVVVLSFVILALPIVYRSLRSG